jgi:hypothetical protein
LVTLEDQIASLIAINENTNAEYVGLGNPEYNISLVGDIVMVGDMYRSIPVNASDKDQVDGNLFLPDVTPIQQVVLHVHLGLPLFNSHLWNWLSTKQGLVPR